MTILFKDDWTLYPQAIVDINTPNKSFVRYAALLKSMGVKNHSFMLSLHNPELVGVNPFDPNLSMEQMMLIALECRENFWYFIREIARDPKGTPDDPMIFRANRGNIALFWLFFNHITTILIQIRQTGKSFSTDILMTYLMNIRCKKTEINLLTKDETLRANNLERLKSIQQSLPFYLKQKHRGDIGNTEVMSVKALGNWYKGHLPNKSPKMALNVGRGLTSPIFQVDEIAFLPNIGISLSAALAAGTAERDRARRNGDPYGTILTTTAGKIDDPDGAFVYDMVQHSAIWSEKFMDAANKEELEKIIRHNAPVGKGKKIGALRVNCTFNHRQLGFTDEWLRRAIEEAEASGDAADRDFGNVWTSGSQSSPLSTELLGIIRNSQEAEPWIDIGGANNYATRWFIPLENIRGFMESQDHVMSIDSSDAVGGDDIAMHLRSAKTGSTTAAGTFNETNIIAFAEWLVSMFVKFDRFTLIIERRSTGSSIIDYLLLMLPPLNIDPFKRIYNKCVQDADVEQERYKEISKPLYMRSADIYTRHKKTFGFATSGSGETSRSDLYGITFQNAAKLTGDRVKDIKTIDQILGLIVKNGRIDHGSSNGDDHVIAWLLSFWLLTQGRNLQHYGINSREVLIDNKASQVINSPQAKYEQSYQERIRNNIEFIVEDLRKERDPYVASSLEGKLRFLASELTEEDRRVLSVDDLLISLREHRKANAGSRRFF